MDYQLTIIIPGKNEEFMARTIQDVLEHTSEVTEVIAVLDGYIPNPQIKSDPRVTVIYNPESVGQRAAANQAAKIAQGKYLMKVDAHCCFDDGFDVKMLEAFKETGDNVTMIPVMKNLHAFDWVCANGHRRYQGRPGNCPECGLEQTKEVVWQAKSSPARFTFCFDKTMHFQYDGAQAKKPESVAQGDLRETLSIQGSCFMLTREKWFELDICSETFNSWGQQGVEVACKTWLSGGRVIANLKTWYAHMFRTNNFGGFPYHNPESLIDQNRELSRELFQRNKWPQAVRSFQWLMDKFNPPGWEESKGIIYFTDSQLDEKIARPVIDNLYQISQEDHLPITSSSLKKMQFGVKNIHFPSLKRGYKTMFKQIIGALENSHEDIIFFCEHDVLYHPSHFDFTPKDKNTFYYNENVWFLRLPDGHALHYDVKQVSGICVYRETALTHYRERYALVEKMEKELTPDEFNSWIRHMGFEPMTHGRIAWTNLFKAEGWKSEYPNIDIKHGANLTGQRWRKEQYRNQHLLINWQETDSDIPGWGSTSNLVKIFE